MVGLHIKIGTLPPQHIPPRLVIHFQDLLTLLNGCLGALICNIATRQLCVKNDDEFWGLHFS